MGLFDTVGVHGPSFICSEGHDLSQIDFQTKDLGETLGWYSMVEGGELTGEAGGYGDAVLPMVGDVEIYADCLACPAFVQPTAGNIISCTVSFTVTLVAASVRKVVRTSPSTAEFIETTPKEPYMIGCYGPMPYAEAEALRDDIFSKNRKKFP